MTIAVVTVRLPRVVEGILRPARLPGGAMPVLDEVPLAIPSFAAAEATLALRRASHVPRIAPDEWREVDGALYSPMRPFPPPGHERRRTPLPPVTAAELADYVAAEVAATVRMRGPVRFDDRPTLGDWSVPLRRLVSMSMSYVDLARVRITGDDGLEAQGRLRARLEANLILVDGVVHHRAPLPRLRVTSSLSDAQVSETMSYWPLSDDPPGLDWNEFPVHGFERAAAYGREMAAASRGAFRRVGMWDFEVLDAAALDRAYEGRSPDVTRTCAKVFADLVGANVRRFGDDDVMAWLRLRRGGLDPQQVGADIEAIRATCEAYPREPWEGAPEDFRRIAHDMATIQSLGRGLLGRLAFEHGHAALLDVDDVDALGGLRP